MWKFQWWHQVWPSKRRQDPQVTRGLESGRFFIRPQGGSPLIP